MVTPRMARYLLVGVVAACISATAAVAIRDAAQPPPATPVAQPSQSVQNSGNSDSDLPMVIIGSGQAVASGGRVTLLPDVLPGGASLAPARVPGS